MTLNADASTSSPEPTTSYTSSSKSNTALANVLRETLIQYGDLTPLTWPKWAEILPKYAGAVAGILTPLYYLDGKITRPLYTSEMVVQMVEEDDTKGLEKFRSWHDLTDAIKAAIVTYGGTDAAARVEGYDTELGDAADLWKTIKGWYGETDTGTEKVVMLTRLLRDEWEEGKESPATFLNRLRLLQTRINSAYRADAQRAKNQTNPSVRSDLILAISDNLLRDLVQASLPEHYAQPLLQSVDKDSTFDDVSRMFTNLWSQREARDEMAAIDARRVSTSPSNSNSSSSNSRSKSSNRIPQSQWNKMSWSERRKEMEKQGKRGGGGSDFVQRKAATGYYGYDKWRGGTFIDKDGKTRFQVPKGSCFACFQDGHISKECRLLRNSPETAKSRANELAKDNIKVPLDDANALFVIDENASETLDQASLDALFAAASLSGRTISDDIDPSSRFVDVDSPESPSSTSPSEPITATTTPASAFSAAPATDDDECTVDSGATRHFTTKLAHLTDYRPYDKPIKINGVFGSAGEALGEGTLTLAGNSTSGIKLMRVMYAPKLGVNLVSQTRMMLAGFRFTNNTRILSIYDRSFVHLLDLPVSPSIRVKVRIPSTPSPLPLVAQAVATDDLGLWHQRTGHPSDERLKSLLGEWNGDEKVSSVCEECIRAKATRVGANKVSSDRATRNLERVSADTWGPSPVRGLKGERFAVVMVDGCSRYAWVEPLTGKGGIGDIVKSRLQQEERFHGVKVAQFQSDNGSEFVNYNLDGFLKSNGIQHRTSVVHSHGQNGFIENRWKTSIETTRALLSSSGMPPSFWPYALSAAVYLYNRTPSKVLDYETPYERYYGKKPEIDNLRVWGCEAWLALPREGVYRVNKLQSRAVKGRFIGYPNDKKGWIFWVPEWKKIVVWYEIAKWNEEGKGNEGVEGDLKYDEWMKELDEGRVWLREGRDRGLVPEGGKNGTERQELVNEPAPSPLPPQSTNSNEADINHSPAQTPNVDARSPSPEPIAQPPPQDIPPPPPTPPTPAPPQRRSNRLAGATPSHYVPLEGAPVETALRAVIPQPTTPPSSPLAYAILDPNLDNDEDYIVAATVTTNPEASPDELKLAIASALSTSPTWTGDHDSPQYWEIKNRPDVDLWLAAMALELAAFSATGTWDEELVELPKGRKAIAVKWVLLIKRDAEGKIIKYKARLVARGDQQIDGVDYDETHSSTVRLASVRFLFALLAAFPHYNINQFDISNAYLLGNLDREIYVQQPLGFSDKSKPTLVRRLRKALYGLKQGGREWQKVLRDALEKIGFKRCEADHGVYVRRRGGKSVYIPTHVDDGLVIGDDNLDEMLDELDKQLGGKLKKIETGLFLGMKFRRNEDGTVEVDQAHYVRSILERFFPNGLNPVVTPLDTSYSNLAAATEEERFDCPYREVLGALLYLSTCTRPDLTFSLSFLGRFAACPAKRHWTALVHVCRYLEGTRDLGLRYTTPSLPFTASLLTAWCDADHGADKDTRRSVSGYVFSIGDDGLRSTAISWLSKRQKSVAISSTEAEYMALSEAAREALWLRHLLRELGFDTSLPTLIRGDNSGSLILASHPTSHSRTKHIDVHYHFTRERVSDGNVELKWVRTDDMVADVFTKGLGREKHVLFSSLVGLRNLRRKGGCEKG